jgi:hypothetical protein
MQVTAGLVRGLAGARRDPRLVTRRGAEIGASQQVCMCQSAGPAPAVGQVRIRPQRGETPARAQCSSTNSPAAPGGCSHRAGPRRRHRRLLPQLHRRHSPLRNEDHCSADPQPPIPPPSSHCRKVLAAGGGRGSPPERLSPPDPSPYRKTDWFWRRADAGVAQRTGSCIYLYTRSFPDFHKPKRSERSYRSGLAKRAKMTKF